MTRTVPTRNPSPTIMLLDGLHAQWRNQAACLGMDPALFDGYGPFPVEVLDICDRCPVRDECLTDALAHEGDSALVCRDGLRGGCDPMERYILSTRRRREAG